MPEARNRNARKKQLYDLLLGTTALHRATGFHATSEDEAEAIKSLIPGARVTVIPNGVVVPAREESTRPAGVPQSNARYLLYMGRLHPYKQIEKIIHGFAKGTAFGGRPERGDVQGVSERVHLHPKAEVDIEHEPELWIAGDGEEDYKIALGTSARDAGVMNRVRFLGHIDGVDKSWVLAHAVAVIQAPKAENFGLVVAEALAHASPCIVGASLPWGGLRTEDCGLWVDDSPVALASAIEHFMALPEARRRAMGERGRAWMVRDFSWESVSKKTLALYEQVVQESTRGVAW
jgi:glycosyltransferase involved in cell wall biosynthesis